MNTEHPPRGLNTSSAAQYVGFSEGFLRKARCGKTNIPGPKFRRIAGRVIYFREDLDSWLDRFSPIEVAVKAR